MKRYPKAFTEHWNSETDGYCGILEEDDFKHEAYLAWKAGRKHEAKLARERTLLAMSTVVNEIRRQAD